MKMCGYNSLKSFDGGWNELFCGQGFYVVLINLVVFSSYIPVVVEILDRNYRYKSLDTNIRQDSGLAPILYTCRKLLPYRKLDQCRTRNKAPLHLISIFVV